MIPHNPDYYVAGMLVHESGEWMGKFDLKPNELLEYAELDARTVAEYDACMCMLNSQQVYALWWDKVKKTSN